ncbi:MAG TPA: zinc ribbon domain-containing protein [Gemmataceae bacterium]|nr:zinc ribbon domain-containing protein [Gemmataceae bacterium]
MRCPTCGTENPGDAKRCTACGERTNRKPRRRDPIDDTDTPFGKRPDSRPAVALRAYRCAVYGLIPLVGLVMGPAALVLALRAWREGRRDPAARGNGHVMAALVLGSAELLCNVVGLALMVVGWTSSP